MYEAFIAHLASWQLLAYPLIALGLAIEGDLFLFGVFLAVFAGVLDPVAATAAAAAGTVLGDIGWFRLGRYLARRPGSRLARFAARVTRPLEKRLLSQTARILFLAKLTYGLHRPILVRFGMLGMTERRFLRADLPAAAAWFLLIVALAWVASETILPVSSYLHYVELTLLIAFLLFAAAQAILAFVAQRYLKAAAREGR